MGELAAGGSARVKRKRAEAAPAAREGRRLVNMTAARMRELILAEKPDCMIGSLPELARLLDVGTVTVQQAARVLEHEGLLQVRRGPGGGYFGVRPDAASLERAVATYLRVRGADIYEALEMMTLLDCELMPAAARCREAQLREELGNLQDRVDRCSTGEDRIAFELELHKVLFKMVDRPLMELLGHVSMLYYVSCPVPRIFDGEEGRRAWKKWRHDIIGAILKNDPDLARFEAERHRRELLQRLGNRSGHSGGCT
jgi:DNA-binding FadR family transcriptional regulator